MYTYWINGFGPRHADLTVLLYLKLNDSGRNTTLEKKCRIYPLLGLMVIFTEMVKCSEVL